MLESLLVCRFAVDKEVPGALEFIIAGASTVGIGTALFYDPLVCSAINEGIAEYLERHEMASVSELVGTLQT